MKLVNLKWMLTMLMMVGIGMTAMAQEEEVAENPKYAKQMKMIERKYMQSKSDAKAVELIKATKEAKNQKDTYVKHKPGYGAAATDAAKLKKFRARLRKTDPEFQRLVKVQKQSKKAKREYFSTIDEDYKVAFDALRAEKMANKGNKKKRK